MNAGKFLLMSLIPFALVPAQAAGFSGWWRTEDNDSIVSIETCVDAPERFCGYLVKFDSTGNDALDNQLCRAPILGDLNAVGESLTGGWIYDPETDKVYSVTIRKKKPGQAIHLRVYEGREIFGETIHWTRYEGSDGECRK